MMDWFSRHNMFSVKLIPVSADPLTDQPLREKSCNII